MPDGYLIPANSKRGQLILNLFLPFDIIMFGTGIVISFILLLIVNSTNIWIILLACLPAAITGILVVPIPNYHNVRMALMSIVGFYSNRRNYIWKGWCIYERIIEENNRKAKKSQF